MNNNIICKLYYSKFLGQIFHTLDYCLQRELEDCQTVLDLGCGSSSPIQYCKNIKYSVGVDIFKHYIDESKKKGIHSKYINRKIEELDLPEKSFDAVILIEVLEHLTERDGLEILIRAEKWAKKKIIITTPNGYLAQKDVDRNPYQRHLSGWNVETMKKLGFQNYGLAGWKYLRIERKEDSKEANLLSTIRFRPKLFWFIIATLSQILTYYFPQFAFELFSVKIIND